MGAARGGGGIVFQPGAAANLSSGVRAALSQPDAGCLYRARQAHAAAKRNSPLSDLLLPRRASQIRRAVASFVQSPPVTRLILERTEATPGPEDGQLGYSLPEMIGIVERVLRDAGLVWRFSRLIIITGHGSSSLNNPHESAHDCGACGGGRGGPNARAYAQMANDSRVRDALAKTGLVIPQSTFFVGAYHNTCDDSVTYFDLDRLPTLHRADF